jgi:hypothetical protein
MGAVSSWNLRLPAQVRPFRYETISDVILHVSYTAREDDRLRDAVDATNGAIVRRLRDAAASIAVSLRRDAPGEWARFQEAPAGGDGRYAATFTLTEMSYPWWLRGRLADAEDVALHVLYDKPDTTRTVTANLGTGAEQTLAQTPPDPPPTGVHWAYRFAAGKTKLTGAVSSRTMTVSLNRNDMNDVIVVVGPAGA